MADNSGIPEYQVKPLWLQCATPPFEAADSTKYHSINTTLLDTLSELFATVHRQPLGYEEPPVPAHFHRGNGRQRGA